MIHKVYEENFNLFDDSAKRKHFNADESGFCTNPNKKKCF